MSEEMFSDSFFNEVFQENLKHDGSASPFDSSSSGSSSSDDAVGSDGDGDEIALSDILPPLREESIVGNEPQRHEDATTPDVECSTHSDPPTNIQLPGVFVFKTKTQNRASSNSTSPSYCKRESGSRRRKRQRVTSTTDDETSAGVLPKKKRGNAKSERSKDPKTLTEEENLRKRREHVKMKNRQHAAASRARRKARMENLETENKALRAKLDEVERENVQLRDENSELRYTLGLKIQHTPKTGANQTRLPSSSSAQSICTFAVCFCFALGLGSGRGRETTDSDSLLAHQENFQTSASNNLFGMYLVGGVADAFGAHFDDDASLYFHNDGFRWLGALALIFICFWVGISRSFFPPSQIDSVHKNTPTSCESWNLGLHTKKLVPPFQSFENMPGSVLPH